MFWQSAVEVELTVRVQDTLLDTDVDTRVK